MATRRHVLLTIFALLTIASIIGTIVSSRETTAEHTIRISLLGTAEDEDYDGTMVFREYVERVSDGRNCRRGVYLRSVLFQ